MAWSDGCWPGTDVGVRRASSLAVGRCRGGGYIPVTDSYLKSTGAINVDCPYELAADHNAWGSGSAAVMGQPEGCVVNSFVN